MKQTAVEFLQESISIHFSFDDKMKFEGLFQQAKEMEKQQIIEAHNDGGLDGDKMGTIYYNELFKKIKL